MFVKIVNYQFKGKSEKDKGLDFLMNSLIPIESSHFGFKSYALVDGNAEDLFLVLRYQVKENTLGKKPNPNEYREFLELLRHPPVILSGPNRAFSKFRGEAEQAAV